MSEHTKRQVNQLCFQHAFSCHVYHRSLRFITYHATIAKKKNIYDVMMMMMTMMMTMNFLALIIVV